MMRNVTLFANTAIGCRRVEIAAIDDEGIVIPYDI
jgi:hypothetical protein